jgi:hypothetical protein
METHNIGLAAFLFPTFNSFSTDTSLIGCFF